jgi:aspartyl-tRNA(Asn)/glutamyl-tRNA(Gln) amidotransferase subunit C
MPITLEEVRHIARLARLYLTPEEEDRYAGQLSAILEYADRLKRVDTDGIAPTASVLPLVAPLRADVARPSPSRASLLANAASAENGMFRVPAVLDPS